MLVAVAPPDTSPESFTSLRDVLKRRRFTALVADAVLIRDATPGTERDEEASRYVRDAMLLFALRKITSAERDRILDVLSFAIPAPADTQPPDGADIPSPAPHGRVG